jgi:glycyl-tRNA synthetase beta chain
MKLMSFWLVFALFLDQFSKKIIVELISPGETIEVLGNFLMITNVGNTGISFGMFQGYTHILIPLVFVIIGMVFIVSLKFVRQSPWLAFAFGSIIGGALGNQIDRLFKGAVVDFVYVNGFAVFNVSDSFVVIGAFILGIHTVFASERKECKSLNQDGELRHKFSNAINSGVFDYFGKKNQIKEDLISWIFNESGINTIILNKSEACEVMPSFLNLNIENDDSPILFIQDIGRKNDSFLQLDTEHIQNQRCDIFFLSSIKGLFKTQVVFENEREFKANSIYHALSNKKIKKIDKKPLLKLILMDKNPEKKFKKEIEGRPVIMTNNDFILEIVTEEIPPTEIFGLQEQFEKGFSEFLHNLRIKHDQLSFFYAARRFGIYIYNMALEQDDLEEVKRGPAKKIAFDAEGNPSKALLGFLRGNKATEDDLIFQEENSNEYCYIKRTVKGEKTKKILEKELVHFLENLNFKKPMRWGNGEYKFVRPIHSILSILSNELVTFNFMGIPSTKTTFAHRFKDTKKVNIESAEVYFEKMLENNVYADQKIRKDKIIEDIRKIEQGNDIQVPFDEGLIDEVTAITEYPNAVLGKYDERFLALPKEVLITTLKHHQRTFPVLKNEKIIPNFLSFQDNEEHSRKNVKVGYRKVIEARLEDALFYYHEDLKIPFTERTQELKDIGFQNKLGSLFDKVIRVDKLSKEICSIFDLDEETREKVHKTSMLLKNDLTTQMVYEFPELQGIMGRIYAEISGETYDVYQAIEEQYVEQAPETLCGSITTLSDNLDTIAGNLLINNIPSGSKDPFGLRRALTKCLKIIISREWDMDFNYFFLFALSLYDFNLTEEKKQTLSNIFVDLLKNRIEFFLSENDIDYDVINATHHLVKNPIRCIFAAKSLMDIRKQEDFINLTRIFERIHNISKNHKSHYYDARLFEHDEEIQLEEKFNDIRDEVDQALKRFDYKTALEVIKGLREPVDNYFDNVFVMSEREDLKLTRLGFLKTLDDFLLNLGNFSEIVLNSENENE